MLLCMVFCGVAASAVAAASGVGGTSPKRVLLLQSFGSDFAPFSEYAAHFRPALTERYGAAIDFYDVSLHVARQQRAGDPEAFLRYLGSVFADRPPDLVVSIGGPAVRFAQEHRDRVFPAAPMMLAGSDLRVVRDERLGPNDMIAAVRFDFAQTVSDILAVLPRTERLAVVLGDSPIERYWVEEFRRDLQPFAGRLEIVWFNQLTFEELKQRAAALPPHSAILLALFSVDAAGVPRPFDQVLREIHAIASAPVFGLFETQLGAGIVGGRLMSTRTLARDAAAAASEVLRGTASGGQRLPPQQPGPPVYDERELDRWRIDETRLPSGSVVHFRGRSVLATYGGYLAGVATVIVLQAALIVALVAQRVRRRRAERQALDLSGRLITAHEDERRRLGRELHDDVTQRLARLSIHAALLPRAGEGANPVLRSLHEELVRLSEDVHALSYRLHPSVIEDLGLVDALRAECDSVARRESLQVAVTAERLPRRLPREVALCLFRVAQEALRNVARHAGARAVDVNLVAGDGEVRLTVRDDGAGFELARAAERASLGLASMRERVRLLGGRLAVESAPGCGTAVTARVPLHEASA